MQWNAWDILRLICWSRCISIFSEMSRQKLQTKWMIILMIFWNNRVSFLIMTFILGSNPSFSASMKPYSKQIARLARVVQSVCYIWDCILTLPQQREYKLGCLHLYAHSQNAVRSYLLVHLIFPSVRTSAIAIKLRVFLWRKKTLTLMWSLCLDGFTAVTLARFMAKS